ncbi:unnamed protein product [Aureobasidium mustum]|uniref:Uncharacterized protein n=1 Tax=Aureobasidium mustum TaxID=2773714 RepID=A0A9N8JUZ0_9PEZI|nr:unnamed protein product [Aureobasidium mustum]
MPSNRHIDDVADMKRPLSPVASPSSPKRVKRDDSRLVKDDNEVDSRALDGWGYKTWRMTTSNPFASRGYSQNIGYPSENENVKFDPAYLDEEYQNQQIQQATENNLHTMEESKHSPQETPSLSPASSSCAPGSPTRYASPSPCRRRSSRPPPRLRKRRQRPPTTPPPAPRLETLTSPLDATPSPLFRSSPRSCEVVNTEEAVHQQYSRNTLGLGDSEHGNIV